MHEDFRATSARRAKPVWLSPDSEDLTLSLDLEAAKKILVSRRQSFVKAPGALALKMRFFPAQRDEELTFVSFAH
jgi:hypothetical protein